jgi:hypothetical protein
MIFSENRFPPSDQVQGQAFPDHALIWCADFRTTAVVNAIAARRFRRTRLAARFAALGWRGGIDYILPYAWITSEQMQSYGASKG